MKLSTRLSACILLTLLAVCTLSCGTPSQPSGPAPTNLPSTGEANPIQTGAGPAQPGGKRLLSDPAAGLASLKSYHVSFHQDVTGWSDGQTFERHTQIELTRSAKNLDFIRLLSSSPAASSYFRTILLDQAVYRWQSAGEACQGAKAGAQPAEVLEPANLLLPVLSASKIGTETVNQVRAVHYRFDPNSLALAQPPTGLTGDVWLAETGGYVVSYKLQVPTPAKPTGKGLETGQSWTYDLSPLDASSAISLPDTCSVVPLDLPALADAQKISYSSGMLDFTTPSSAVQTVAFYLQKLTDMGWTTSQTALKAAPSLPFATTFTRNEQILVLNIDQGDPTGLDVTLVVYTPYPVAQLSELNGTPAPQATVDPSASGLASDLPLYPGATGLIKMSDAAMFNVPAAPALVVSFFNQQMPANGWTKQSENTTTDTTIQIWQKAGRTISLVVGLNDGVTYVVLTPIQG